MSPLTATSAAARAAAVRPRLTAFVTDDQSEDAIRVALQELAREPASIQRGDVTRAIAHLGAHRSPHLLIVDIGNIALPLSKIQTLAEVCEPGVRVIAIGNRSEIGLYRDLVHAGVSDYIVKPLTPDLVTRAVKLAIGEGPAEASRKLGKAIAVLGTRGGVGTTTVAVNLAWHLANRVGRRVALVDLDLQTGDCGLALGLSPASGLREALENPQRVDGLYLERIMATYGERLFVLSGEESLADDLRFPADGVEKLLTTLQADFHYVVLDLPRTPSAVTQRALDMAALRVIVADESLRAAREIGRLRPVLAHDGAEGRNLLVINRSREKRPGYVPQREFLGAVEMKASVVMPLIKNMRATAAEYGAPAAAHRGPVAEAVASLAGEISGRPTASRKWWAPWR